MLTQYFALSSLLVSSIIAFDALNYLKVDDSQLYRSSLYPKGRSSEKVNELWFDQRIDHFNDSNRSTFKHRYYSVETYYKKGGPALLYLGGEGELNKLWSSKTILTSVAKAKNGVVYALEHRYYGKSTPFNATTVQNLKYLNSLHALYDIKNFIENVDLPKRKEGSTNNSDTKWVVIGGSYPGNLAAWTKMKFDNLVVGAIASSAPVQAHIDFFKFDQQVQLAIKNKGGKKCLDYYLQLFQEIDRILLSKDRKAAMELKKQFGCEDVNDGDFAKSLDIFSAMAQYDNYPNSDSSIKTHCSKLNLNVDVKTSISDFAKSYKKKLGTFTCKQTTNFSSLKNTQVNKDNPARLWLYQCCNEFGYWQTAPHSPYLTLRSKFLDVNYHEKTFCSNLFFDNFKPNVNYTNSMYKGDKIQASNLVFTNGEFDPWLPLSVTPQTKKLPKGLQSYIIKGAAHVSDLIEPLKDDTRDVLEAKKRNIEIISNWVH